MTKQLAIAYLQYKQSDLHTLSNCYKSPSLQKERAYNKCTEYCKSLNGTKPRILHYNTYHFTYGFLYTNQNNQLSFCYILPSTIKHGIVEDIENYILTHDIPQVYNHN